jgi:hypothetical protein
MTILIDFVTLSDSLHLCLSQIFCIASGFALLEDEQNFKLVGCVDGHKMSISCVNMLSNCKE